MIEWGEAGERSVVVTGCVFGESGGGDAVMVG